MPADGTAPHRDIRLGWRLLVPVLVGMVLGAVLIYPAAMLAIISGGMGHGHYSAARALFPVPMLLTRLTENHIGVFVGGLALAQLPAYGGYLGWCWVGRAWMPAAALLVAHLLAALACFSGAVPNFS